MSKLRHGIIGCGLISTWHAYAINELSKTMPIQLVGAADVRLESARDFCAKYGVQAYETIEDMLNSDEIDSVSICTPSGFHANLAMQAAKHGKHIVVEKPMAITTEQLNALEDTCKQNHVILTSISQMRFLPNIQRARKAVQGGELGKMLCGDVYMKFYRSPEYYGQSNWRGTWKLDGGGALMNQGIHGIDQLLYIMGPVKSVYARCKTLARKIEVEDTASVVLEYESGALGVIQGTTSVYPGYPKIFDFNGELGTIKMEEKHFIEWKVKGKGTPSDIVFTRADPNGANRPDGNDMGEHIPQLNDFFCSILENRPPMIDVKEGRRPVDLILAIYESSRTDMKEFANRG